jgi:hypothetical protein
MCALCLQSSADDTPLYAAVSGYDVLKKTLEDKLNEYNETNAVMELVLFQQAMEHITRISRIIDQPRCVRSTQRHHSQHAAIASRAWMGQQLSDTRSGLCVASCSGTADPSSTLH